MNWRWILLFASTNELTLSVALTIRVWTDLILFPNCRTSKLIISWNGIGHDHCKVWCSRTSVSCFAKTLTYYFGWSLYQMKNLQQDLQRKLLAQKSCWYLCTPVVTIVAAVDVCALGPCNGNGDCSSPTAGSFECRCYDGFSGVTCNVRNAGKAKCGVHISWTLFK